MAEAAKPPKAIPITVNTKQVEMTSLQATGLEIKQAAIAQGVQIQPDFLLSVRLENGGSKNIADNKTVTLTKKHRAFTAVDGDDNS